MSVSLCSICLKSISSSATLCRELAEVRSVEKEQGREERKEVMHLLDSTRSNACESCVRSHACATTQERRDTQDIVLLAGVVTRKALDQRYPLLPLSL